MLNVDGLSHSTLEDVRDALDRKRLDFCVLLETKRRSEDIGLDISLDGYSVQEVRRSDTSGDRSGGGIAVYTKKADGIIFQDYHPVIEDKDCHFVNKERVWF